MAFWEDDAAEVHRVVLGGLSTNAYGLRCKHTGAAVLVDAPGPAAGLVALARRLGADRVLLTHGHHDHVGAVPDARAIGCPVSVSPGDAAMVPDHDDELEDDRIIVVGRLRLRVIATPGHTPGSTCFGLDGSALVLAGDTLFPGGPGATRWAYSDFGAILSSIERRLFDRFGDDTVVLPGHGEPTTIGAERPHLAAWAARGW